MKKPTKTERASAVKSFDAAGDDLLRSKPLLMEHLSCAQWEEGGTRKTSTLLLFVDAGTLKACLNDRSVGRAAFVSANSLRGLLDALEAGLMEDALEWRSSK